ncbi:interferon-induced, double-stranded RNA-activated protein kinase [Amia ocellicauda]|uniref:interferon-induced, double-stranded RNA-activated protein kinase n=1 Tax=Amia ocellicauda TaxID=2972642 RepID=UPI0034646FDB
MAGQNYIGDLNEYGQKNTVSLEYQEVSVIGPAHVKQFTIQVVIDGQAYPEGVGKNKKEAKYNAAKNALEKLRGDVSQQKDTEPSRRESCTASPILSQEFNFLRWLNEYSQKNKISVKPNELHHGGPAHLPQFSCRFTIDGKEYPEAFGKNKKDAKKEAAKLVYYEMFGKPEELDENGNEDQHNTSSSKGSSLYETPPSEILNSPSSESESQRRRHTSQNESRLHSTNYIGVLNDYCQKTGQALDLKLVDKKGFSHDPVFVYEVIIGGKTFPEAEGKSAKEAKQSAALIAVRELKLSDLSSEMSCNSSPSSTMSSPSTGSSDFKGTPKIPTEDESSEFIVFKDTSTDKKPKESLAGDVRSRIKLAPVFNNNSPSNLKKDQESIVPSVKKDKQLSTDSVKKTESETTSIPRLSQDFESIEPLGKGGFGRVFKARQKLDGAMYAVKIAKFTEKSRREVEALARFQHRNIVRYYSSWIDAPYQPDKYESYSSSNSGSSSTTKCLYIQMELCDKGTLRTWIDERTNTNKEEALKIFLEIVQGVEYIHSQKRFHRDLKPVNILFANDRTIKIGDFGLAAFEISESDGSSIQRTIRTGTLSYMSPEQESQRKYGKKVDIFPLGLICFELLWQLKTKTERYKIWHDLRKRQFPLGFSKKYSIESKYIEKMLAESPEDRPEASEITKYLTLMLTNQEERDLKTV